MLRAVWVRGLRAIQIRKNVRVTKIAVNSDAAMPAMSVTAKPRTGPVRGFAVTLIAGIAASLFTSVFVTRTFYILWLSRGTRVQHALSI